MAQADWDFTKFGSVTYQGGDDGTARLHSSLGSPLVGEGDYCRDFTKINGTAGLLLHSVSASVNGGEFNAISESYSWSVRAWMRQTDSTFFSAAVGIGIKVGVHVDENIHSGYRIMCGGFPTSGDSITLCTADEAGAGSQSAVIASGLYPSDTWLKGRLDVIPDDTNSDTLRIYTGTGTTGSEIWTQRGSDVVLLNTDSDYCAWGDASSGKIGVFYYNRSVNSASACFVDRLQIFKELVP